MNCQIKICHPLLGEILAITEDLSDKGVLIRRPDITKFKLGGVVTGPVQHLPIEA